MRILSLLIAILLLGCGNDGAIRSYRIPKQVAQTPTDHHTPVEPQWSWAKPTSWLNLPASGMRLASFDIPVEEGTAGCSVILLSGDGGGLVPNINRWRTQLGLVELGDADILGAIRKMSGQDLPFTFVVLENPDLPQQAFLAAIFNYPSQTMFVKCVLPRQELSAHKDDFLKFCASITGGNNS